MKYTKVDDNKYMIRLMRGEKVIAVLTQFFEEQNLQSGSFTALGAVDNPDLAYYDLDAKKYVRKVFQGTYELLNATGNVSLKEGKPLIHMHATISGHDYNALGGHVFEMDVGPTFEMVFEQFKTVVTREKDEEICLHLLNL